MTWDRYCLGPTRQRLFFKVGTFFRATDWTIIDKFGRFDKRPIWLGAKYDKANDFSEFEPTGLSCVYTIYYNELAQRTATVWRYLTFVDIRW